MPKSNSTVRPHGCTSRLPPCRSPWNTPWISAPSRHAISPARSTASVSTPASCIDSTSSNAKPRSRSITRTRARHEDRVRARHDHRALLGGGEHVREVEHVLGLEAEVELLDDLLGEQLDERRRVGQRGDGDAADEQRRRATPARAGPSRTSAATARALHLHDDLLAGEQARRVHLRDRRRRERLLGELGEHRPRAAARARARRRARTSAKRSGGTWSRSFLNSSTSSSGNRPSKAETIWPELHVRGAEPLERRDAGAARAAARDSGVPRSRRYQAPSASADLDDDTRTNRPTGGRRRRARRRGTSARVRARIRSRPRRQTSWSGSTTHGPASVKA